MYDCTMVVACLLTCDGESVLLMFFPVFMYGSVWGPHACVIYTHEISKNIYLYLSLGFLCIV